MRSGIAIGALVMALAACGSQAAEPATHSSHRQFIPPAAAPLRAGERFVTLTMPQPYTPAAPNGGTDEYRCFLIDPGLKTTAYLTGSQFLPQNPDIVHHAIFFRVGPADAAKARSKSWQCFGDAGIGDGSWVASWAPGANEVLLGRGLGYELPPGSRLVMQVHYNLLTAKGTDQSAIRLRLADGPMTPLNAFQLLAPVELPCTAQESGPLCDRTKAVADVAHRVGRDVGDMAKGLLQRCGSGRPAPGPTQHCDYPVDVPGTIYAAAGHMHLLGRSIKIEINPGTSRAVTVLDVPQYNFDDQAVKPLATPITVKSGDAIRVTCTHDASLRKRVPQLQPLPPRYVVWGDGTSDEMCVGLLIGTAR